MLALVIGLFAAYANSALAADTLTPPVFSTTLQAGQSTTVNKTLHLDGLPARADIIVAIDTTGSMGIPIAQAQADAVNICNQVQGPSQEPALQSWTSRTTSRAPVKRETLRTR